MRDGWRRSIHRMTRYIKIQYGHEFKLKRSEICDDDFFYPVYCRALEQLEEIILFGEEKEAESSQDHLHNIIAFCGERGQGKTSAMLSFTDALKDNGKVKAVGFAERISALGRKFIVLDPIDPTQMEDNENIISIILSRSFIEFRSFCEDPDNKKQCEDFIKDKNNLLERFKLCYEQILTTKSKNKPPYMQHSYEEILHELLRLGDSSNLRNELNRILKAYFKFSEPDYKCVLVLQIDDTDLNIHKAYEIVEDLRKYFCLPHVIILMASKIEQLCEIVEQQFRKDYAVLLRTHTTQDDPRNIASKYLGKLLPENRRIYLPEPAAISDRADEKIEIRYMRDVDDITVYDITRVENVNGTPMVNLLNGNTNFQESILQYVFQKTGIRFATPEYDIPHYLMPKTLRGLIDLLTLLSRLKDFGEPLSDKCAVNIREEANQLKLNNLETFEQYFMKSWIPSNIDRQYMGFLLDLSNVPTIEKHQRVITDIWNILENDEVFSLLNTKERREGDMKNKGNVLKEHPTYYSVGDVMDALVKLNKTLNVKTIELYCFAIRTIYTLTMYKLYYRHEPVDRTEEKRYFTILDEFIGGDLFGVENQKAFFPSAKGNKAERGYFSVGNHQFIMTGNRFNDKEGWNNQRLYIYESYEDDTDLLYQHDELYDPNGKPLTFTRMHFWVSIRFVRRATFRYKWEHPHECYMVLLNMEYLWRLVNYQVANPNRSKDKAEVSIFLKRFYRDAKKQLESFKPVPNPMNDWYDALLEFDLSFLDMLYSLLYDDFKEYMVFPTNRYAKDYRVKNTLQHAIKKFIDDFKAYTEKRGMIHDESLFNDLVKLQENVGQQEWDNAFTKQFKALIQGLADSLVYKEGK